MLNQAFSLLEMENAIINMSKEEREIFQLMVDQLHISMKLKIARAGNPMMFAKVETLFSMAVNDVTP